MSFKNVFWGVLLLTIGLLYALRNFDVIWFSWSSVADLWPLLLLLWGISLIPAKPLYKLLGSFGVIVLAVILVLIRPTGDGFDFQIGHRNWSSNSHWNQDNDSDTDTYRDQAFSLPVAKAGARVALNLEAAAGRFELMDTTNQLISFESHGNIGPYMMEPGEGEQITTVDIKLDNVSVNSGQVKNEVIMKLNPSVIWNIKVEAGASKVDMDLKNFMVRRLELDGGASSVDIIVGSLMDTVDVDLEVGVSSLSIAVPQASGCELRTDAVLSGRRITGFEKISTGLYRTNGFDTAKKKIYIDAEAAISDLKVERY
ncbi:MAG TPA: hypothetical protein DCR43_09475 [Bacteroidales bacterium]|nr:MAG: hypothetical protein A2X11_03480 [Bacteroidetes bacterium GWE2_42_24]OFY32714.1 MAG: hypothetical protein A2X09_06645 [Bacteroidetes bacterium GWF2_43_11]HAQ66063.1 hypothetical protein [Bacteroidales bacterium]HBZ65240.1 hypothetical protein [Bacteroidales bacterium]